MAGIHAGRRGYHVDFVRAFFLYALWVTESRTMLPGGIPGRATFYFWVPGLNIVAVDAAASVTASGGTARKPGAIVSNQHLLGYPARHQCFPNHLSIYFLINAILIMKKHIQLKLLFVSRIAVNHLMMPQRISSLTVLLILSSLHKPPFHITGIRQILLPTLLCPAAT